MQKGFRIVIAAVVVIAILAFMTTYTVRFTEKAVITTFGRADESSVKTEPGLGIKWPYPIQSVITYDTRARFTETKSETLATADNRQVILQTYLVWKVTDPLAFFRSYGNGGAREIDHVRQAEETLRAKLRSALAETSRYRLTDLLNATQGTEGGSKLGELEAKIKDSLTASTGAGALKASGIEAVAVGIESMELPQSVTEAVFKSMQATQEKIAGAETQRGQTEAATIKNKADSDAKRILAFADKEVQVINGQAQKETAKYLAMQKEDPRLAVFLQQLRFMREGGGGKRTTLVLPLSMAGFQLFDPGVQKKLSEGVIPEVGVEQGNVPARGTVDPRSGTGNRHDLLQRDERATGGPQ